MFDGFTGLALKGFAILTAIITFLGCWGYAIATWGWFVGLAFGWIPSIIIAIIAAALSPLLLIGIVIIILWQTYEYFK